MPGSRSALHTKKKKQELLTELHVNNNLIATACRKVGVDRRTYYDWIKNDPEFKEKALELKELVLDKMEDCVHEKMFGGDTTMAIFYAKTKGKERGYIERKEVEHSTGDLTTLRDAMNDIASGSEAEY